LCSLFAGRRYSCRWRHSDHLIVHHQWEYSYLCARSCSIVPIALMGKLLTCLHRLTLGQLQTLRSTTECKCHRDLKKIPSPPWETHNCLLYAGRRNLCLFRHGHNNVFLDHRQQSSWIGACSCSKLPSPRWENCSRAYLDFRMQNCGRRFDQLQFVRAQWPEISHHPHGKLTIACCTQGGGIYVSSGTVTITSSLISGNTANYVRAHAPKFPPPRWETHVLLVVCRVAVSGSGVTIIWQAQWQSYRAPSVGTQQEGCALVLKISHLGDSRFACRLQGGGVLVYASYDSTVSIVNSQVYSNWAYFGSAVRAHAQKFPSPRWKNC
jgi:hypothetical protein